jgi:hypothetical protein
MVVKVHMLSMVASFGIIILGGTLAMKTNTHTELAFYKGNGTIYDKLIRWYTGNGDPAKFSHVEIVLSREGENALLFSSSPRDGGVRQAWRKMTPDNWECITVPIGMNEAVLQEFISLELKSKYDWFGIFGSQILARGWQSRHRWFCSEICARVLGLPRPQSYSPESLRKFVLWIKQLSEDG